MKLSKKYYIFLKWALGAHGLIHVIETFLNIYEKAYYSACLSLLSSTLMLLSAFVDVKRLS